MDGQILAAANLTRGYVYKIDFHDPTPKFHADVAADVDLIACLALRAIERESWGTPGPFGIVKCPCHTVDASDAIIWMVGPADGDLLGQPSLRHPVDVETDRTTMILFGEDGPGIRPPEQDDIFADIEAFLSLK